MVRRMSAADPFRVTLLVGGLPLVAASVWVFGVLEPQVAFTIPRADLDRVMGPGFWMTRAGVAAGVALIPVLIAVSQVVPVGYRHPSRTRMVWARVNGATAVAGAILGAFAAIGFTASWGFLALDDAYPGALPHRLPWFFVVAGGIAAPLLVAAAASSVVFALRRPCAVGRDKRE